MNYSKWMQMQINPKTTRRCLLSLSIATGVWIGGLAQNTIASSVHLANSATLATSVEIRLAQNPPNQSDVTGPDVGNPQGPEVGEGTEEVPLNLEGLDLLRDIIGDETDLDTIAQSISQALDEAYNECRSSGQVATPSEGPRRFARGARSSAACSSEVSQACQRLNQLVGETRTFISNQTEIRDRIRLGSGVRWW